MLSRRGFLKGLGVGVAALATGVAIGEKVNKKDRWVDVDYGIVVLEPNTDLQVLKSGNGVVLATRRFDIPPLHYNCRCIVDG